MAQWLENLGFRAQQHPASATAQGPGAGLHSSQRTHARVQRRHVLRTLTLHRLHPRACAGDLKTPFMGNKVDGTALAKDLSMAKLEEDYGVSDEDQRKKIYGSLKDVMKKDSYTVPQPAHAAPPARAGTEATHRPFGCSAAQGNTNYYSQMLMWLLPFGAIYLWLSLKYEKQIARYMKRYRKWQDQRNPKPPPEPKVKR